MRRGGWPFLGRARAITLLVGVSSCSSKEAADPVPLSVAIEFPSTAAAVVTDSVQLTLFDASQDCRSLITLRKTDQPLPRSVTNRVSTPCELQSGAALDAPRGMNYTLLAVAQVADKDFLIGCVRETSFGEVLPLPVALDYVSNDFTLTTIEKQSPGVTTRCARLTDKCAAKCSAPKP